VYPVEMMEAKVKEVTWSRYREISNLYSKIHSLSYVIESHKRYVFIQILSYPILGSRTILTGYKNKITNNGIKLDLYARLFLF
jgi:hypothetical protein